MIRINLLPAEYRHEPPRKFKLPAFVSPKGLLVFLAVLVIAELLIFAYLKMVAEPKFAARQIAHLKLGPDLKAVRDIKNRASAAQEVNRQLLAWIKTGTSWTSMMNDLSAGMEKGVWLTHLTFERRDDDAPIEADSRAQSPVQTAGAVNPNAAAAAADIKDRVNRLGRKKQAGKERRAVMVIRARVVAGEDQTAVTGRLIENLKNRPAISGLIEDLRLDEIRRTEDTEVSMFDFVISGAVRREYDKEFFNLP